MDLRLAAVLVAVLALQPSCVLTERGSSTTTSTESETRTKRSLPQEVRVTRDGSDGPESCSPQEVGELVVGFLGAVSEGEEQISTFFAPDMEWYSLSEWSPGTGKRNFVTYGPEKLDPYFERRAKQHERQSLLEIDVSYELQRNIGHITYNIERTADDLPKSDPIVIGKGAIDCETGTILVWSMSHDTRYQDAPALCPGEAEPPKVAIACAR